MFRLLALALSLTFALVGSAGAQIFLTPTVRHVVGTLNDLPDRSIKSNGTNDSWNIRRPVYLPNRSCNIAASIVGFASNASGEINIDNAVTFGVALELNGGATVSQFTWSGATTVTVQPGDIFDQSDKLAICLNPGQYFIRLCGSVAPGGFYYYTNYTHNGTELTAGGSYEEGVGLACKALSGTISGGTSRWPHNVTLVGDVPASAKVFGVAGDSISIGTGGYVRPLDALGFGGDIGPMAGYLSGKYDYVHYGRASASFANDSTHYAKRLAHMTAAGITDVWSNYGINDFRGGETAAATLAFANTWYTAVAGVGPSRIYQSTVTPCSMTGNTVICTGMIAGERQTFNATDVRGKMISHQTDYVEQALAVELSAGSNLWNPVDTADFLHPNQTGGQAMIDYAGKPF